MRDLKRMIAAAAAAGVLAVGAGCGGGGHSTGSSKDNQTQLGQAAGPPATSQQVYTALKTQLSATPDPHGVIGGYPSVDFYIGSDPVNVYVVVGKSSVGHYQEGEGNTFVVSKSGNVGAVVQPRDELDQAAAYRKVAHVLAGF